MGVRRSSIQWRKFHHLGNLRKIAFLKSKELSNTLIKKQFEVTSKEEEIFNGESQMQGMMEPILEQLVGELKEVVKASKELVLDFPRQNIIMLGDKLEEIYDIKESLKFLLNMENSRILLFYKMVYKKSVESNSPQARWWNIII